MSWQLLVALTVVLYSINGLLYRSIMKDENSDAYAQAFAFTFLVSLFCIILQSFHGRLPQAPTWNQFLLSLLTSVLSSAGLFFSFKGFKSVGASEHTILLTTAGLWATAGAVFVLRETLTIAKMTGFVAILAGVLFAEWKKQAFVFNKGAACVLLAALLFAASGTVSLLIVRNYDVLAYMMFSSVLVAAILFAFRPRVIRKVSFYFKPGRAINIISTSVNDSLANIFGLAAYQIGRNALQIGPLMATQTLLTVLLAVVILKERDRIPQKVVGGLFAVIGASFLV